jgi:negative regulator of flagellin synthesis FlgM
MYIQGTSTIHQAQGINAPHRGTVASPQKGASTYGTDQVDISPEAEFLSLAHSLPDIRQDRVAEIRAQIASGTYETDEKLNVALDRLLDELA